MPDCENGTTRIPPTSDLKILAILPILRETQDESKGKNNQEQDSLGRDDEESESSSQQLIQGNQVVVEVAETEDLQVNQSNVCNEADITFEEHFQKPEVQRAYKKRLLLFEMKMKICFLIVSLIASIIAFQDFYKENKGITRTILLVNTFVLWAFLIFLPIVFSRLKAMSLYPSWLLIKVVSDTVLRIYQTIVVTCWADLIFVEIWKNSILNGDKMPYIYVLPAYHALSLIIQLVNVFCFTVLKVNVRRWYVSLLSHCLIELFFFISMDILTYKKKQYMTFHLVQVCMAAAGAEIEHLIELCKWRKDTANEQRTRRAGCL